MRTRACARIRAVLLVWLARFQASLADKSDDEQHVAWLAEVYYVTDPKRTGRAHFTQPLGSANKKTRKAQLVPQLHTAQVGPAPYVVRYVINIDSSDFSFHTVDKTREFREYNAS